MRPASMPPDGTTDHATVVFDGECALLPRRRYGWFGRRRECYVPAAGERERFLG